MLTFIADLLRARLKKIGFRWRKLPLGKIALIVLATLRHDHPTRARAPGPDRGIFLRQVDALPENGTGCIRRDRHVLNGAAGPVPTSTRFNSARQRFHFQYWRKY
jgi:hypothetical protein